jgi:hypothetical protein
MSDTTKSDNNQDATRQNTALKGDLTDSPKDAEKLKPDATTIALPDVDDIPGQEHIHVAPLGEMADTTISSDDEEGLDVFDDANDGKDEPEIMMGTESDVQPGEQVALQRADEDMPTTDDTNLRRAELDTTDLDNEPLNEAAANVTGEDLDTSGVDGDDPMERIGEEDEENNNYSLGSDSNDNVTEGTP